MSMRRRTRGVCTWTSDQPVETAKTLSQQRPRIAQVEFGARGARQTHSQAATSGERTQLRRAKSCNVMSDEQLQRINTEDSEDHGDS